MHCHCHLRAFGTQHVRGPQIRHKQRNIWKLAFQSVNGYLGSRSTFLVNHL